jgi:hypothetical protein
VRNAVIDSISDGLDVESIDVDQQRMFDTLRIERGFFGRRAEARWRRR